MRAPDPHWLDQYQKATVPTAKLRAGLKAFFDIDTSDEGKYYCPTAAVMRVAKLDPSALDDLLHERHGDYEERGDDGMSMRQLIAAEYGEAAASFVEESL